MLVTLMMIMDHQKENTIMVVMMMMEHKKKDAHGDNDGIQLLLKKKVMDASAKKTKRGDDVEHCWNHTATSNVTLKEVCFDISTIPFTFAETF